MTMGRICTYIVSLMGCYTIAIEEKYTNEKDENAYIAMFTHNTIGPTFLYHKPGS